MGRCTIDHSQEDTLKKLQEQRDYLPVSLMESCEIFLRRPLGQETLNEVFHLLKKYDLATEKERLERNQQLEKLLG
ncbi:group-specific protein [Sporosarcina cascadiensis]|uniref:group-specific protein n=1 Tax=Sporosarcina cascadiensis TaxID=2660747 RepID=UPI00129BD1CD|nr:group-specific protein [Sporosarcina cascadiensis]